MASDRAADHTFSRGANSADPASEPDGHVSDYLADHASDRACAGAR